MSPLDYSADGWIPPWRPGLAIGVCAAGDECGSRPPHRFVAITLSEDGFCVTCAVKRGRKSRDAVEPVEQMSLDGL